MKNKYLSSKYIIWYHEENNCPSNAKLVEQIVGFGHSLLLGNKNDMDDSADASRKVCDNRDKLV